MTSNNWRGHQCKKKDVFETAESSKSGSSQALIELQMAKKPIRERLFPLCPLVVKPKGTKDMHHENDNMLTDKFDSGSEGELDIICNMISFLPIEFSQITEVTEEEDECLATEKENHKPLWYYVMNNRCVEEENAIFERPHEGMRQHLKPLFIWAKVDNVGVNKVLVDGGAEINLMRHSLLKKIGKYDINLRPHNMVLSNYEGKTSKALGVTQVDIIVGTITIPTITRPMPFVVGRTRSMIRGQYPRLSTIGF